MKNNNQKCAETKIELIKQFIEMDCEELKGMLNLNPIPFMINKLTSSQVTCLNTNACSALGKKSLHDFYINFNSFKNLELSFNHVIFHLIDSNTIENQRLGNRDDFHEEIYYIVILSNERNLALVNFNNPSEYNAYFVDRAGNCNIIQLTNEIFAKIRMEFLTGIGRKIRQNTSINYITEYIIYPVQYVEKYLTDNEGSKDMWIKILVVNYKCLLNGTDAVVNSFLRAPVHQDKMAVCFATDINTDFYDIAQMWP